MISNTNQQPNNGGTNNTSRIRGMERRLYLAAATGSVETLEQFDWKEQKTPAGNNVLHVHVGKPIEIHEEHSQEKVNVAFIEHVLVRTAQNSILRHQNKSGDTPLHLAAKFGHFSAVQVLIERAKLVSRDEVILLLNTVNVKRDSALHIAARAGRVDVVELLVKEDPDNVENHRPNAVGETPVFLAAERCSECVFKMLEFCSVSTLGLRHKGPCGLTPLHVAVQWGTPGPELVRKILQKDSSLIRIQDNQGLTPVHHAATQKKKLQILDALLYYDDQYNSSLYIQDNEGRTALHFSALEQNIKGIDMIMDCCPDCIEIVDNQGRNVVHYVANWGRLREFEQFLKLGTLCHKLINEKDNEGNTPLHLLSAIVPTDDRYVFFFSLAHFVSKHSGFDVKVFNNLNLTAGDVIASNYESIRLHFLFPKYILKAAPMGQRIKAKFGSASCADFLTKETKKHKEISGSRLVVAALIATVSFTAGFTVPGGYDQNPGENIGMAVLAKKVAFKAFMVSDTIAFILSSIAVVNYFVLANRRGLGETAHFSSIAHILNSFSLFALMVAFTTGVYAIVSKSQSLTLAIYTTSAFVFLCYIPLLFRTFVTVMRLFKRYFRAL